MVTTNGARETVGETVTGQVALDIGRALGSTVDRVVVGHDGRRTANVYRQAVGAGMQECGADVVDVGVQSTPTIARAVDWYDADAGLVVRGIDDGAAGDAFSMWTASGRPFDDEQIDKRFERAEETAELTVPPADVGSRRRVEDAGLRHLAALPQWDCSPLSVVVDVGGGHGRLTADALLTLGCDVTTINATRTGADTTDETMGEQDVELRDVVADSDAALGIGHASDADRLVAVDETGRSVTGDELLALFAIEMLPRNETVAMPVTASALVHDVVRDVGGSVRWTAAGADAVVDACADDGAVFGGTPSGAWIWPDETLIPDGHYAACRLAHIVANGSPLSARIDSFPTYARERTSTAPADPAAAVADATRRARSQYEAVTAVDGVRVDVDDGWFLVRAGTPAPLVSVTAEARTQGRATELRSEAMTLLEDGQDVSVTDELEISPI